jgi:hypothetical protein
MMTKESIKNLMKVDNEIISGLLDILKMTSPGIDQVNARKYMNTHIRISRYVLDFVDDYLKWKSEKLSYPKLVHHVDLLVYNVRTTLEEELQGNATTDQTND